MGGEGGPGGRAREEIRAVGDGCRVGAALTDSAAAVVPLVRRGVAAAAFCQQLPAPGSCCQGQEKETVTWAKERMGAAGDQGSTQAARRRRKVEQAGSGGRHARSASATVSTACSRDLNANDADGGAGETHGANVFMRRAQGRPGLHVSED